MGYTSHPNLLQVPESPSEHHQTQLLWHYCVFVKFCRKSPRERTEIPVNENGWWSEHEIFSNNRLIFSYTTANIPSFILYESSLLANVYSWQLANNGVYMSRSRKMYTWVWFVSIRPPFYHLHSLTFTRRAFWNFNLTICTCAAAFHFHQKLKLFSLRDHLHIHAFLVIRSWCPVVTFKSF